MKRSKGEVRQCDSQVILGRRFSKLNLFHSIFSSMLKPYIQVHHALHIHSATKVHAFCIMCRILHQVMQRAMDSLENVRPSTYIFYKTPKMYLFVQFTAVPSRNYH